MKKFSNLLPFILFVLLFWGCKKDKTTQTFSDLFKNTEWTGDLKYTTHNYYDPISIEFNQNGNFAWHEYAGDYSGTYTLDEATRKVSLRFLTPGGYTITATITQNNTFSNATYPSSFQWSINTCGITSTTNTTLDNTKWKGSGAATNFDPEFLPGMKYKMLGTESTYLRTGSAIRFSVLGFPFFFVLQANNKLRGIGYDAGYFNTPFELTKQ